jgi:hypothetical protein
LFLSFLQAGRIIEVNAISKNAFSRSECFIKKV